MARKEIKGPINDGTLNNANHNFKELYEGFAGVVKEVSETAFDKVVEASKLNWKEPVDSFNNLPSISSEGDTIMARSTGKVYRFNGLSWNEIQQIDAGPVNELDSRLMSQLAETTKYNTQTDFVDLVDSLNNPYENMYFLKTGENAYQLQLSNKRKGIIYSFIKNTNDDFIILHGCFSGLDKTGVFVDKFVVKQSDLTGTFISSGSSFYTTNVGDSFEMQVQGEDIDLIVYSEIRGGMWEIKIDGGNTKKVSCYNSTTIQKRVNIAKGLNNVMHTVTGRFLGDDPAHPQSVGTARGYLRVIDTANEGTLTGFKAGGKNKVDNTILATSSNKEFAFAVVKNDLSNWIPEHDDKGSAFKMREPEFYVDDKALDVASMSIGTLHKIDLETFKLKQKVAGHVVGFGKVMELSTHLTLGKDGIVHFDGKMLATDSFTATGYPLMLPSDNAFLKEFVTGILNKQVNNLTGSEINFTEEKDKVFSGAVIDKNKPNLVAACTLKYPYKSYRIGATEGKPKQGEDLFLWNRSTKPKLYFKSMENKEFVAGEKYSWGFKMIIADIDDVYEFVAP